MSIDPDSIRSEPHQEIGRLIEENAETLIQRWYVRALHEQEAAQATQLTALRNHLVEFVRALGRDLITEETDQLSRVNLAALRHGEQRWHVGWRLDELVRDYQMLRLVILEWLSETLNRPLTVREIMAIGLVLDEAISAAVVMYVAHQDETLKQNEETLRSAKVAAEAANAAKGEFLANISHELRTPMNSILGMSQLALEEPLSPTVRDYLDTIKDQGDILLSLLNEILDYSRLESGRFELDPHPFQLRSVLDETLRSLSVRADEKRIELACDLASDVPDSLIGDSLRFRQIVTNLLSNAIKFTDQGEVVLSAHLHSTTDDTITVEFIVADTGIGIAPEMQQEIFEPFAQAAPSTTRQYGGTGLGLAIAGELTTRMGGRLWLESELGKGSKFHFTSCFERGDEVKQSSTEAEALAILRDMPVLVVDDNESTRGVVERILHSWGMRPHTATDVPSARIAILAAADRQEPFKMAILDAILASDSGFDLVEPLRTASATPPHILMMFPNIDRSRLVAQCEQLALAGYLIKPVSSLDLWSTVLYAVGIVSEHEFVEETIADVPATVPRRRVLLAEDTPANQKLFKIMLKRQHFDVVVAENGRDAVEKFVSEQPFDLVLMDVQMPVMDGLKAATVIRSLEKTRGGRVPIVALTAHALPRDKQRCLAAGMDGYLSKPFDVRALETLLEQLVSNPTISDQPFLQEPDRVAESAMTTEPIFNRERALQRLGGKESLFKDLVTYFFEDTPDLLRRIREGVAANKTNDVAVAAHSIKGLAANFDGLRTVKVAQQVEQFASNSQLAEAAPSIEALHLEVEILCQALAQYRQ